LNFTWVLEARGCDVSCTVFTKSVVYVCKCKDNAVR
jgi:hypothetical protein